MAKYTRLQNRRGLSSEWSSNDPILAEGEIGFEIDTSKFKIGDGETAWSDLEYENVVGPTGPTGPQGSFGGATFKYSFLTDTTDSDPGTGNLKFNNTISSATELYIDFIDGDSHDVSNYLELIDDSTSSVKGHFKIHKVGDENTYAYFSIIGNHYSHDTYYEVPVAYLDGTVDGVSVSWLNADPVAITFVRTGDMGDIGPTGPTGPTGADSIVPGPTGPTGPSSIRYVSWTGSGPSYSSFNSGDIIYYNGSSYVAIMDVPVSTDIQNNSYWSPLTSQGPTGPAGPIGMNWIGPWQDHMPYSENDVVYYNGSSWIAKTTITGMEMSSTPEDYSMYWDKIASKGNDGVGFSWKGQWNEYGYYIVGDVVEYLGSNYVCKMPHSEMMGAQYPDISPMVWEAFFEGPTGPAGPNGPAGINWLGDWQYNTTYYAGDAVNWYGTSYLCTAEYSGGMSPDEAIPFWDILAQAGTAGTVGNTGPTGPTGPTGLQYSSIVEEAVSTNITSSHIGKLIRCTSDTAMSLTINTSTGFSPGEHTEIIRDGLGEVSIVVSGGVNFGSAGNRLRLGEQYSSASLICISANDYRLVGDLKI